MIVYRIQHSVSGDGPYCALNDDRVITDEVISALSHTQCSTAHPSVWLDCNPHNRAKKYSCYDYYCGFNSWDQMIAWFMTAFDALYDSGFVVAVYEIDCRLVITGTYQIVFVRDAATLVETIAIPDMLAMA